MGEQKKPSINVNNELRVNLATEVVKKAELIQVIQIEITRGNGTEKNPVRRVYVFFLPKGDYIGEMDPLKK